MSVVEAKSPIAGVELRGASGPRYGEILNEQTLAFLADLHRKFNPTRLTLLKAREERQKEERPDPHTTPTTESAPPLREGEEEREIHNPGPVR